MRTAFFFYFLVLSQGAFGQWFNTLTAFTTQNGLSNNTVTCLQKDSTGFLWIGTHEGLNRYDGTAFMNVLSNTKNNLPSNNITRLCAITNKLLAVATEGGLCLLNTATLEGRQIELPYYPKFAATGFFIEDVLWNKAAREIWVCTGHGVFVLNEEGVVQRKLLAPLTGMPNGLFAKHLLLDKGKNVYFYSPQKGGFYYPDFAGGKLAPLEQKFPEFPLNNFTGDGFVLRSAQMLNNEAVCTFSKTVGTGSEEYVAYYNIESGRRFTDKLSVSFDHEKRVSNMFPLNDTVFVVNSYFGEPLLYNTVRHELRRAADHPLWFTSWPDGFGAFLLRDHDNVWIGTPKGLLQSSLKMAYFKTAGNLTAVIQSYQGLVSYNYGVYDKNKLWVACLGAGLFGWDTAANTVQPVFTKATHPDFNRKKISTHIIPAGGPLWLFSVYGPVQVDPQSKKLTAIEAGNKEPSFNDWARLPLKDSKGNIWTSLPDGLAKYNIASATFTNYKTRYAGGVFPLLRPGPKTEDGNGCIWMARQDTLVKFDPVRQTFSVTLITKNGKPVRPVSAMASDGAGLLYLSAGGAFGIYHISSGAVDLFTKQTGIISTVINDVVADTGGNAWMATEGGLVFYNRQKAKFSSFTKADGLPDDNIVAANFADEKKSILFLGFAKTYCLLQPQNFLLQKSVPQNVITRIEADDEPLPAGVPADLSYRQNSISFTYTGINYNQGQQNNYACMLEGFDQEWKYTGTERKINYVNLPPGPYTFKVKAANHQGEWNDAAATFSFRIAPPFWQRWWFRAALIAGFLFSVYYIIKQREASLQKEAKRRLQMSELRMQALRAQMNPHFIFNSLNSIQNYILNNNTMDAAAYLSKFAKLMRRILDQSRHNFLPLGEVMETLKMYLAMEAFRFNNEFSYDFFIEDNDDLLDAPVPPMLFQPFVENAVLHGLMPKEGEKKLRVSCRLAGGSAEVIIDDNGVGRTTGTAKAGHESQGGKLTAGMLESLQQLQSGKASIEMTDKKEDGVPTGTTVKLVIPLKL